MHQLEFVALNENVNAEPDALHIIAQKADGAMRDALSIFDQLVSFSGRNISYQQVIDNLNVLDYDYYFRITDCLLGNQLPEAMLLLDEIINGGFDGQHFVTGMGEHLRNLLICKDSITLKLLEVSAGLKDRYHKQASRCNAGSLLKALDIANRCDIDYRASNNKRLHVELAILQMGSLMHQQATPAPATSTIPVAPQPVKEEEKISKPAYQAGPPAKPVVSEPIPQATPAPPPAKAANEPSRMPTTGISIKKSIGADAAKPAGQEAVNEEGADDDENPGDAAGSGFTNLQLEKVWEAFAKSVAAHSPNLHATLTQSKPKLVDEARSVVLFTIHSQLQQKEITIHKAELLGFLRDQLANPKISIQTEMADTFQDDTPYTPMEKYRKMAEKNPNLVKLKEKLNLEIDF